MKLTGASKRSSPIFYLDAGASELGSHAGASEPDKKRSSLIFIDLRHFALRFQIALAQANTIKLSSGGYAIYILNLMALS
jgi:hypothetical protein